MFHVKHTLTHSVRCSSDPELLRWALLRLLVELEVAARGAGVRK